MRPIDYRPCASGVVDNRGRSYRRARQPAGHIWSMERDDHRRRDIVVRGGGPVPRRIRRQGACFRGPGAAGTADAKPRVVTDGVHERVRRSFATHPGRAAALIFALARALPRLPPVNRQRYRRCDLLTGRRPTVMTFTNHGERMSRRCVGTSRCAVGQRADQRHIGGRWRGMGSRPERAAGAGLAGGGQQRRLRIERVDRPKALDDGLGGPARRRLRLAGPVVRRPHRGGTIPAPRAAGWRRLLLGRRAGGRPAGLQRPLAAPSRRAPR